VKIYRRHEPPCPFTSRDQTKCGCPCYADARAYTGKRENLDTRDWKTALRAGQEIELRGFASHTKGEAKPVTLAEAQREYFEQNPDYAALRESTKRKHRTLLAPAGLRREVRTTAPGHGQTECYPVGQLTCFAESQSVTMVEQIDARFIARFRSSWTVERQHPTNGRMIQDKPLAAARKLERFRQFCKFLVKNGWLKKNPMTDIKTPTIAITKKQPFTAKEIVLMLEEIDKRIAGAQGEERANCIRLRVLILFMRFSGLRISDAVGCMVEWVKGGRVQLTCRKNGREVNNRLPSDVLDALADCPPVSPLYWFWSGKSSIETATKKWQEKLSQIFEAVGIQNGHAHRFRHTLAVDILERGGSFQMVAAALGDSEPIVRKHYSAWSQRQQELVDASIAGGWAADPLLKRLGARTAAKKAQRVVSIKAVNE
jgi:site-specific recombinase XerD